MNELGTLVGEVGDRIADSMGEHALALTTSLSLSEDRITGAIDERTDAAERKLVQAQENWKLVSVAESANSAKWSRVSPDALPKRLTIGP